MMLGTMKETLSSWTFSLEEGREVEERGCCGVCTHVGPAGGDK